MLYRAECDPVDPLSQLPGFNLTQCVGSSHSEFGQQQWLSAVGQSPVSVQQASFLEDMLKVCLEYR